MGYIESLMVPPPTEETFEVYMESANKLIPGTGSSGAAVTLMLDELQQSTPPGVNQHALKFFLYKCRTLGKNHFSDSQMPYIQEKVKSEDISFGASGGLRICLVYS